MKIEVLLCYFTFLILFTITNGNDELGELKDSNRKLASAMYTTISNSHLNENIVFSPFATETILGLLAEGSTGNTEKELMNGMFLPKSASSFEQGFKKFIQRLKIVVGTYLSYSTTRIYLDKKSSLQEEFKKNAQEFYNCEIEKIDFNNKKHALSRVNYWHQGRTFFKFDNIVSEDDIENNNGILLLNAIYFNSSEWFHPLNIKNNFIFYNIDGSTVETPALQHFDYIRIYENDELDAKFLELPYKRDSIGNLGKRSSLVIVLPNEDDGIKKLENNMDKVFAPQKYGHKNVFVRLPQFKIQNDVDLKDVLKSLGINSVFQEGAAELGGIVSGNNDMFFSKVFQKISIEVDQGGTEVVSKVVSTSLGQERGRVEFIADHPFIFYIKREGMVLFSGRVVKLDTN